jgi:tetratricopeptide (TPR) repeat protein
LRERTVGLARSPAETTSRAPAQADKAGGAHLRGTRRPAAEYLGMLRERASELLAEDENATYRPGGLTAVTQLAYDQLRVTDPDAALLASAFAFLAPEPVSVDWLVKAAASLPGELASRVAAPLALSRLLSSLSRTALVRLTDDGLTMHGLTQAILRVHTQPPAQAAARALAEEVVAANSPDDVGDNPGTWPAWARLLPHLLAIDPAHSDNPALHSAATRAVLYLTASGSNADGTRLGLWLYEQWRSLPDPSGMRTLEIASAAAEALRAVGEFSSARKLDEMVYGRCRIMFGNDHPKTLAAANSLGLSLCRLGELHQARILLEDAFQRQRQALGPDHPGTLTAANSLALTLRELEEYAAARELDEDTVERCRRTLGEDQLDTLRTAGNLAANMHFLGLYREARTLNEDTLERYRRILGDDHPHTLRTASNLAGDLCELGVYQTAIVIGEDVLARRRQLLGNGHPDTRRAANNLINTLMTVGDYETVLALLADLSLLG